MRITLFAYKVFKSVCTVGIGETCWRATRSFFPRSKNNSFDLKHQTDTGGILKLWELDIHSVNAWFGVGYMAIPEDVLRTGLEFLAENWIDFSFVDLGAARAER